MGGAVCTALTATCKLIGPDLITAVLPAVIELVGHPKELVRKKAVMVLHRCQQLDPEHEGALHNMEIGKHFRQALCDKASSLALSSLALSRSQSLWWRTPSSPGHGPAICRKGKGQIGHCKSRHCLAADAGSIGHERGLVCAARGGWQGPKALQEPHPQLCQHLEAGL